MPRSLAGSPGYSLPFSQGFSCLTHSDPRGSLTGEGGGDRMLTPETKAQATRLAARDQIPSSRPSCSLCQLFLVT